MKPARIMTILCWAVLAAGCQQPTADPSFEHVQVPDSPRPVAEFELLDQHGESFNRADLQGQWTVLFSGFTHCPDICPATLGLLKSVEAGLEGAAGYRTVFVSVDPDRDTPAQLREYLDWFNPDWIGLTGPPAQLGGLLDSLGMAHVRVPLGEGDYTMDHTTAVALINPDAMVAGYWKAPLDAAALAEDLGRLSAR